MKFRDLDGQFKDIVIKTGDTLPVGSVVEYEGSTPPAGWSKLSDGGSVIVSSEEPTTGEEVWIQKGKNLFDKGNANIMGAYINAGTGEIQAYYEGTRMLIIKASPNTTYTISKISGGHFRVGTTSAYPNIGVVVDGFINGSTAASITITTNSTAKYLCCSYWQTGIDTLDEETIKNSIQVEKGTTPTEYEPYINKKIHTNTGNGYEEFYNEENREIYSTSEQRIGTYLGKPLYRKTYIGTTNVLLKHGMYVAKGLTYIDKLVSHKGFITFVDSAKTFVHEIGCYESAIHFSGIQLYKNGGDLSIFGGDGYAIGSTYDLTIEYTKTTD